MSGGGGAKVYAEMMHLAKPRRRSAVLLFFSVCLVLAVLLIKYTSITDRSSSRELWPPYECRLVRLLHCSYIE